MLTNLWNRIELWCISDRHDEPVKLKLMEASPPFYACPKYMLKDEQHPDGHSGDERMCSNVLSLKEAEDTVMEFLNIVEDDIANGITGDYTNFTFTKGFVKAKVIKYSYSGKIRIGVENRRTLKK